MPAATRIKVAQIGFGYWGPNLLRNLAENAQVDLVAVCDQNPAIQQKIAAKYPGVAIFNSLEEMLTLEPGIQAIVVATPAGHHFAHAMMALQAGKHVFVEKPMANSMAEGIQLVETAMARNLTLMVGHTFLYNNIVRDIKRRVDSGELGEIHYAYSQRLNLGQFRRDSDVLWTLAPHDISILNYWFDARPAQVSARGITYIGKGTDIAEVCFAQMDYPDGRSTQLHLSWLDPQKTRKMVLVGSQKMLVYDDVDAEKHIQIYDKRAEREHRSPTDDFADFTTRLRAGDLIVPNTRLVEPLAVEIAHFVECVRTGDRPLTHGLHGLDVLAVLEAMSQSMKEGGRTVPVLYPHDRLAAPSPALEYQP